MCETFLVGDDAINVEGFQWIGNNTSGLEGVWGSWFTHDSCDALTQFTNFKILGILDVAEVFSIDLLSKMPDHSLLTWDLTFKNMIDDDMLHTHVPGSKHYRKIPDNFFGIR